MTLREGRNGICLAVHISLLIANAECSIQGLSGVPPSLALYKEDLGLLDPTWSSYGKEWQELACLWVRAETTLVRMGLPDLTFAQVNGSTLPTIIKDWMFNKLMSLDAVPPEEGFGNVWTSYLKALPVGRWKGKGGILKELWCRPGKTGCFHFLLGLHWQALYSGAGNDWTSNVQLVHELFKLILSDPQL